MPYESPRSLRCLIIATAVTACGGGGGGGAPAGSTVDYVVAADVQFPASANDAVWDEQRQLLYLSLPSSAGPNGNVVLALDPRSNTVVRSQFAGSEPARLALSDDGQYLYAGINGSGSVQRFRLPDLVPDLNVRLNRDDFSGQQHAVDLQVMPGASRSIVVARGYLSPVQTTTSTVIYDDAVARPRSLSMLDCTCGSLQWAGSATRLYASNNQTSSFDFYDIDVDASGLRIAKRLSNQFTGFNWKIHYSPVSRLLYSDDGVVFDPAAGLRVGGVGARGPMAPDPSRGRLYFATAVGTSAISGFDSTTLQPAGVQRLYSEPTGLASKLLRWGSDGLALVAPGGSLHIFGGSGNSTFSAAVPQGTVARTLIRGKINRLAWDAVGGRLYASVSSTSSAAPNSILVVNPVTGEVVSTKSVGQDPNALTVSDDGQYLYVGLDGSGTVQRLRLPGLELDATIALGSHVQFGSYVAGNLKTRPGFPRTLAVSRLSVGVFPPETGGIQVFDDAIARPVEPPPGNGYNDVDWNLAGTQLFSGNFYGPLHILNVEGDGVRHQRTLNATFGFGVAGRLHVDRTDGQIYHDTGRVVDPDSGLPSGTYVTGLGAFYLASDAATNRVFTLTMVAGETARIDLYDRSRFTRMRTYSVPFESGLASRLIQVGPQHVAFITGEGMHVVRLDPT